MGEFSKMVGDVGEDIVNEILSLVGWTNLIKNNFIDCHKNEHEKKTHGIDSLFVYKSPLESNTVESVLVSSKFSTKPYNSIPSTFRDHFKDIAHTVECYSRSNLKKELVSAVGKVQRKIDTGVLFYLNNDTAIDNQDVVTKLQGAVIDSSLKFRTIHIIDNKRAAFLFDSVTYLKNKYGNERVNFFYPPTTLNIKQINKTYQGKVLPVEFITSPIIPLVIDAVDEEQPIFCLIVDDVVNYENLELLVEVSRDLVSDLTKNILILFSDYNAINNKNDVDKIQLKAVNITGKPFNIKVGSFRKTFLG